MRRVIAIILLAGVVGTPAAAFAQSDDTPVVDVVEIAGIIDRPVERYSIEQIDEAERNGAALIVFQVDSLGGLKIDDGQDLPPIVRRIRDAEVPVAVHVGPRAARASGVLLAMMAAADIATVGPSARLGPLLPLDVAHPDRLTPFDSIGPMAAANGRQMSLDTFNDVFGANAAVAAGLADAVVPSVADLLRSADGRDVAVGPGRAQVTLSLPADAVDVRFVQPGPIRRLLHTFANPTLVYIMLMATLLLLVFELFQPGFGVAGWTAVVLGAASIYGLTVLPARALGLSLLLIGALLATIDVAMDGLGLPTLLGTAGLIAGSLTLYPNSAEPVRLSPWLIGASVAAALIVYVPVMTVVRRARQPIAREARGKLIGEAGRVRSMLNPEGFIDLEGEIWRARSRDGSRMRVGEDVVVDAVDGAVLIVRAPGA